MKNIRNRAFAASRFFVSLVVMTVMVFGGVVPLPAPFNDVIGPQEVLAAEVDIDTTVRPEGFSYMNSGSQTVFIDDQTGYKFYQESTGVCVYRKTTNGGTSWGSTVTVDSQIDCLDVKVWYDRWTPNDFGNYIHIVTMDVSVDDLFYNRLDTSSSDTLLMGSSPVDAVTNSGNSAATFATGTNYATITKGTDGTIYLAGTDTTDSYVVECTSSCNLTTGWTETGTNPMTDLANDYTILVPLASNDIMLINRDISAEDIRHKIWRNASGAWDAAWTIIDSNATDNTTYDVGLAFTIASSSSAATTTTYLGYTADNATPGADDDIRLGVYSSTWSTSTPVLNSSRGITGVAIARDDNTGNLYLGYTGRTTAGTAGTGNVYWRVSSTSPTVWSAELGPVNTAQNDIYGLDFNIRSNERIFASWYELTGTTISGDTLVNPTPGILVGATSTQITEARATSTNLYLGGKFSLVEGLLTRDVESVTITEQGSIDAQNGLDNIRLYHENDTVYPYDCVSVSYGGSEDQYGTTDTDSFSGANGSSTFTETVSISTTSALCLYALVDVENAAVNLSTIDIEIADPTIDVTATLSPLIMPTTTVAITGSTTVFNDNITLTHYHWRNDDGTEGGATSATGGTADTPYSAYPVSGVKRLRVGVSTEGSTTTQPMQFRLEYAAKDTTCNVATGWTDVGAGAGDWDMSDTVNLTNGNNTTNISVATGGIADENTDFLVANGGQRDTSSQTGLLTISSTTFAEFEYSVVANAGATAGNSYCFRLTDAGAPLDVYSTYPEVTIAADFRVSATSTQAITIDIPASSTPIGAAFVIASLTGSSANITEITLTASGTIDYDNDISNLALRYDTDTTAPYDCASESYNGTESQYGATSTGGFSATATSTFSGSVPVNSTQSICVYSIFTIDNETSNGETLDISIQNPSTDVVRSSGTIGPLSAVALPGVTTLVKDIPTQIHYHFRNDDGSETTATSKTAGTEDTALTNISKGTTTRLRIEVSNEGGTSTAAMQYRLEYAHKVTSCAAASGWTDVGAASGDWDMRDSANLTDGNNTTNIAVATGGTTDENATFLASNAGVKDTTSQTSALTLASTTFVELEYSIVSSSTSAAENSTYCFRVSNAGVALPSYSVYPEIGLKNARDFKVQRGVSLITAGTVVVTAGVDYEAPAASTSAFVRITNTQHTGAGRTAGTATQNANDITAYILNPWNVQSSFTLQRETGVTVGDTRIAWEIVEYVGPAGGDNEMIIRQQQAMTFGTASTTASSTAISGIVTPADVAVFITGVWNPDTVATNYNSMLTTAALSTSTDRAVFTRGTTGADAVRVSFAVVEFIGTNWKVQRVSHTYTATGTAETESIAAVNSTSRAFIHVQKSAGTGLTSHANYGHEVWLSSVGAVSFQIDAQATSPTLHTSVAWIIENTQTKDDVMLVTRSNGTQSGGAQPFSFSTSTGATIDDLTAASIFANSRSSGIGVTFPEPMMMFELYATSSTEYRVWVSNTTDTRTYRAEVVEWPTARRELAQNYYRIYTNNNALDPTDPWPLGATDLGENTAMSGLDLPMGPGEDARIRMSLNISGQSSMPPGVDAFKLQYGKRVTSCSAISTWQNLGDSSSTTAAWRANDTSVADGTLLSVNPPTAGDLNLSVSDRAGTYEENNNSAITTYIARSGEDMEFDWSVENNVADTKSSYCFRMVETDEAPFDAYNFYPTLRTIGYGAESKNWRWYDDAQNETPTAPLDGVAENTTPINVTFDNTIALRFTLKESNGAQGSNVKFKLQFSESPTFDTATDVSGSSTCSQLSYWCYDDGGGVDNAVISSSTLTDAELCFAGVGRGCGTHNASGTSPTTYDQPATSSAEFSFIIRHAGARVNRTYYFRAYDVTNNEAIATAVGESFPSLTTEGAELTFVLSGVATSTNVEGVTTDVGTTPTAIPFGDLPQNTNINAAYLLDVTTDATEGYQMYVLSRQGLLNGGGDEIAPILASNTAPIAWATACDPGANGCFGYHAGDDTLSGGSARFSPNDTYAALETAPKEVAFSSIPVVNEETAVIYRALVRGFQPAGQYETELVFISVPVF